MKKKTVVTNEDKKVWKTFVDNLSNLPDKDLSKFENVLIKEVQVLDLHGLSLDEANFKVIKFIENSYKNGFRKLKIITGKGKRSKNLENPYVSETLGILKNSVPNHIKNNIISKKIIDIVQADEKNGGEGAFFIYLKK